MCSQFPGEAAVSCWAKRDGSVTAGCDGVVLMVRTRRTRTVDELTLPEAEEIVLMDAEMRQLLVNIAQRQAGGGSKSGRYNKHDTGRARFIKSKALVGLRLGILVPEADLRMLRLPPQEQLRRAGGADWVAMEASAQLNTFCSRRHGSTQRRR